MKIFFIGRSWDLGRIFWSFRRRPIVLFTVSIIIFKWSSKDKQLLKTTPKSFCELVSDTLLMLKASGRMVFFFCFSAKYYFLRLFTRIRIETQFPTGKSIFCCSICILNNRKQWSVTCKKFAFDDRPAATSFIYIKKVVGVVWNLENLWR